MIPVRTAVVEEAVPKRKAAIPHNTAVVEEEVPIKALHVMTAGTSHSMALKMTPSPLTAGVEQDVPNEAVHAANAAISLHMAMRMKAVAPWQRCRRTSAMSWDGTTCRQ